MLYPYIDQDCARADRANECSALKIVHSNSIFDHYWPKCASPNLLLLETVWRYWLHRKGMVAAHERDGGEERQVALQLKLPHTIRDEVHREVRHSWPQRCIFCHYR